MPSSCLARRRKYGNRNNVRRNGPRPASATQHRNDDGIQEPDDTCAYRFDNGFSRRAAGRNRRARSVRDDERERVDARDLHEPDAERGQRVGGRNVRGPRAARARSRGTAGRHARLGGRHRAQPRHARTVRRAVAEVSRAAARAGRGPARAGRRSEAAGAASQLRHVRERDRVGRPRPDRRRREAAAGALQRTRRRERSAAQLPVQRRASAVRSCGIGV
ncbi:hypothetical protein FEP92_00478 [Burkholderia multivorans]|nr:hypothetical protein [Burkholderia multivorans]